LRDHLDRKALALGALRVLVLDEADEMLDMGFREELEAILGTAPSERRTILLSATLPRPIVALAKRYTRAAVRIAVTPPDEAHADIAYRAHVVAPREREHAVVNVLRHLDPASALVFRATREAVQHLATSLGERGFRVAALSGELTQPERTRALKELRDGRARVLVATDVAARGLDLPSIELVVHVDLPRDADALRHRSGRTGRAGRKGVATDAKRPDRAPSDAARAPRQGQGPPLA
jgi:ATP-dependent RNA helicase DeaD